MKAKGQLLEYHPNGRVLLQLQEDYRQQFRHFWEKHKAAAVMQFDFAKAYRKRTTGDASQNHHINGHVQQICAATGNSFSAVKDRMKELAIDRGYPIETLPDGSVKPQSEAGLNTVEAGYLIDTIHQFAAEWNIKLIEDWGEK